MDQQYTNPIIRELIRQKGQGYLQEINGRMNKNSSFEIRFTDRDSSIGELLVSLNDVQYQGKLKIHDIAKNLVLTAYGWAPGKWKEFRQEGGKEVEDLEHVINGYQPVFVPNLMLTANDLTLSIYAKHADTINSIKISLPIKKPDDIPTDRLNYIFNYISMLTFKKLKEK